MKPVGWKKSVRSGGPLRLSVSPASPRVPRSLPASGLAALPSPGLRPQAWAARGCPAVGHRRRPVRGLTSAASSACSGSSPSSVPRPGLRHQQTPPPRGPPCLPHGSPLCSRCRRPSGSLRLPSAPHSPSSPQLSEDLSPPPRPTQALASARSLTQQSQRPPRGLASGAAPPPLPGCPPPPPNSSPLCPGPVSVCPRLAGGLSHPYTCPGLSPRRSTLGSLRHFP